MMDETTRNLGNLIIESVRKNGREMEADMDMGIAVSRGDGNVLITTQEGDQEMRLTTEQFDWLVTALDK